MGHAAGACQIEHTGDADAETRDGIGGIAHGVQLRTGLLGGKRIVAQRLVILAESGVGQDDPAQHGDDGGNDDHEPLLLEQVDDLDVVELIAAQRLGHQIGNDASCGEHNGKRADGAHDAELDGYEDVQQIEDLAQEHADDQGKEYAEAGAAHGIDDLNGDQRVQRQHRACRDVKIAVGKDKAQADAQDHQRDDLTDQGADAERGEQSAPRGDTEDHNDKEQQAVADDGVFVPFQEQTGRGQARCFLFHIFHADLLKSCNR